MSKLTFPYFSSGSCQVLVHVMLDIIECWPNELRHLLRKILGIRIEFEHQNGYTYWTDILSFVRRRLGVRF